MVKEISALLVIAIFGCKSSSRSQIQDFNSEIKTLEMQSGVVRIECNDRRLFCVRKEFFGPFVAATLADTCDRCVCDKISKTQRQFGEAAFPDCDGISTNVEKESAMLVLQRIFSNREFFQNDALTF